MAGTIRKQRSETSWGALREVDAVVELQYSNSNVSTTGTCRDAIKNIMIITSKNILEMLCRVDD